MQVSESNKQEAEKVVDKHTFFDVVGMSLKGHTFRKDAIHHAIQDRQSVLEDRKKELKHFRDTLHSNVFTLIAFDIEKRITNLTEQINYLKSKL